ncbi:hypothetical protein Gain_0015_021 [Komagataeibacter intermedius TF2]|uniref:Uncharacterized protein n=1 Tax=Komagataeibacter intermedius NRIC 0521 TaxID=1307934 RepID=A0ABQ0PS16_9PROT|nr:hypothetical protein Gain_0015_021 [Komagataeibacter intermedius TF2]GBQ79171.1 hypothetical protein AA0521_3374 [Komagataeibacter intermedius NRIC 0521]
MTYHGPFYTVPAAFQGALPVFPDPAAPDITIEADSRGNIKKDKTAGAFQPLWKQTGIIALNNPARPQYLRVMKHPEVFRVSDDPVSVRKVAQPVEVYGSQPARP